MICTTHLLLFAICVFCFQLSTKVAIEYCENIGDTNSPLYVASICGVFASLFTGVENLYQVVKHLEEGRDLWEERPQ